MNDFYKGVILSLLRKALTGVSAVLVTNGWLTNDQTTQLVLGLSGLVVSIILSVWDQYGSQLVKLAGLQLPAGSTMQEAKNLAKTDAVASVTTSTHEPVEPASTSSIRTSRLPMWVVAVLSGSLLLAAGSTSACAKANPNMSPERQVALYGIRANSYLKEVRTTAAALYAEQVIPKAAYDKFLVSYIEVNKAGERLADALAAYDAATTPAGKDAVVAQIDAALVTLSTLLPNAIPEVTSADGRAKIGALVGEVQKLLLTISRFTAPRTADIYLLWPRGHNDRIAA